MAHYCYNCKVHFQRDSEYCIECGMKLKIEKVNLLIDLSKKEVSVENETIEEVLVEDDLSEVVPIESESSDDISVESKIIDEPLAESEHELSEGVLIENKLPDNALIKSKSDDELLAKNNLSNIVLVTGILAGLFLFWSFIWWIIIRDGNPNLVEDLDILIVFCSPGLILGMVAIILGNKDLVRMRVVNFKKRNLNIDITGIILGAGSVGMTVSLIVVRWILFL